MAALSTVAGLATAWLWSSSTPSPPPPPSKTRGRFFSDLSGPHAPTVLPGGALLDYVPTAGSYRVFDSAFACGAASSGQLDAYPSASTGHQVVAMDEHVVDYVAATGEWRVLRCPPAELRQGFPNPTCRKVARGAWAPALQLTYLGGGRLMAWSRRTLRFELWSFAERGGTGSTAPHQRYHDGDAGHGGIHTWTTSALVNGSTAPFFLRAAAGSLGGVIHNESALLHLQLRQSEAPQTWGVVDGRRVNAILELLPPPRGANAIAQPPNSRYGVASYRLWNSELMAALAPSRADLHRKKIVPKSYVDAANADSGVPLSGPVGRGHFPLVGGTHAWASHAPSATLVGVDAANGQYRLVQATAGSYDTLHPALTLQGSLHFVVKDEGTLGIPKGGCAAATTRFDCAAAGAHCGWCDDKPGATVDALRPGASARCTEGDRYRPCRGVCEGEWRHAERLPPPKAPPPAPPAPPPPYPPGIDDGVMKRIDAEAIAAHEERSSQLLAAQRAGIAAAGVVATAAADVAVDAPGDRDVPPPRKADGHPAVGPAAAVPLAPFAEHCACARSRAPALDWQKAAVAGGAPAAAVAVASTCRCELPFSNATQPPPPSPPPACAPGADCVTDGGAPVAGGGTAQSDDGSLARYELARTGDAPPARASAAAARRALVDKAVLLPRAAPRLPTTMTIPGVATAAPAPRAERPIEFGVKATVEAVLSALAE